MPSADMDCIWFALRPLLANSVVLGFLECVREESGWVAVVSPLPRGQVTV